MNVYKEDAKKKKKVLEKIVKVNLKNAKPAIKFCYILTALIRTLACVLGLINIYYAIFLVKHWAYILFLTLTFVIPFVLSFIPYSIYQAVCKSKYIFRKKEKIIMTDKGLTYSYHDDSLVTTDYEYTSTILYENIKHYEYDKNIENITIFGSAVSELYLNGELKQRLDCEAVSFLNIFEVDIVNQIENIVQEKD